MSYTVTLSDGFLSYQLARNPGFLSRVEMLLIKVALEVLVETGVGSTHAARANFATLVMRNSEVEARKAALHLAQSTNVIAAGVTYDDAGIRTGVSDAALYGQVFGDWNKLAGIDAGS